MSKAPLDPGHLIDLERFPIHNLDSSLGCDFLRDCQAELDATGACNLTGFVKDRAVDEMVAEALVLVPLAYRKDTRRNAYFTQDDPALPPDHPLRRFFPLRMAQLANDVIPKDAAIQQLYEWIPLTEFIRRVLGLEALYRTADPFLALNLTYLQVGDLQPWHYDHNEFTVTLLLKEPESGGEFEYVPKLRTDDDENFEAVGRLFAGTYGNIHTLPRRPGTLTIFKGRHAMHRVTEVHGDRLRISALFSYDGLPNQRADDATNAFIYGPRVAAILTGGR